MTSFTQRVIGAAKLDAHIYEEVEADTTAMGQALGVVALSSVAAGIGAVGREGTPGLFGGLVAALLGWLLWAGLTYFIGTRILPTPQTHADWCELLRTTGSQPLRECSAFGNCAGTDGPRLLGSWRLDARRLRRGRAPSA